MSDVVRGEPGETESLKEAVIRLRDAKVVAPVRDVYKPPKPLATTPGPVTFRGEPGETAPPIGYDPKIITGEFEVKTAQDADRYVTHVKNYNLHLSNLQDYADKQITGLEQNLSTAHKNLVVVLRTPDKYTPESLKAYQKSVDKYSSDVKANITSLNTYKDNLGQGIITNKDKISKVKDWVGSLGVSSVIKPTTPKEVWTVTDPRTGEIAKFTEKADARRYLDNLNTELITTKFARVSSEARQEWERMQEVASQSPARIALANLVSQGVVTHESGIGDKVVYKLVDSVYHLTKPNLELAKTAGFDITIGKRKTSPWTPANERQLNSLFSNSVGLSGGTSIGNFEKLGTDLAKSGGDVIFNPVGDNPTLEWVGNQLIQGGIKAVPLWVGGRLAMAVVGPTGMVVIPLWQYLAGVAAGAPLVPQVDFVVPKDVYARNQQMKNLVKEHPELFLEVALEGVGGLLTMGGLEAGLSKIQQARINKIYGNLKPEDFFVDEEILMQYPEDASYQQIIHETIYQPVSTHLVSQDVVNPASLIKSGFKEGSFYKIGDEYGIVMIGEGAIPVKITPGMQTTPTTVWKPIDITNVIDIIQHNPGIKLDLNRLTSQGIKLPAWLAGAGVKISVLSKSDLKNLSIAGNEIIMDQDGKIYYRTVDKIDVWSEETSSQRQGLSLDLDLADVLSELPKFQSVEIPTMELIEIVEPGITLDVAEISDVKIDMEEVPLVLSGIGLDIALDPVVEVEIPKIDIDPLELQTQLPADPIERQVQVLRQKMLREGKPGVARATKALRLKLNVQKRKLKEARRIKPSKKPETYYVYFQYATGASEREIVDAKSFHHAYNVGEGRRKIRLVPIEVTVEKRG